MANGTPPMDPDTSEATAEQLDLARAQGGAHQRALEHMSTEGESVTTEFTGVNVRRGQD